ncbi:MAG: SH3 domain-containing protein [Gemmataceae bacterium]|nr:SH3 domain-containing protein [Gemmataceae bacterium]
MRPAVLAGLTLAVLPAAAAGQNGPRYATVTDAQVTLRAGPSPSYPEAGTLAAGARVVIDHEDQNGWYAVVAPPGSVSWVPNSLIDFDPTRGIPQQVTAQEPVVLAPGRLGLARPLVEVRKVKVPEGTVLTVIGPAVTFDGKKWYPVAPPDGDYRYLPMTAVERGGAVTTSHTVKDTTPPGLTPIGATIPSAGLPPAADPAGRPGSSHPLWAQAEEAERAGRYDDAERLFFQVARETADGELANRCFGRIHTLREKQRGTGTPAGRPVPPETGTSRPPAADPPGRTATILPPVRNDRGPEPAAPPATGDRPAWSAPGTLTKSPLALDGRQTYSLDSSPGVVVAYVVPAAGVDLGRYVRQRVRVYGTSSTRRDLSKPYVVASDVQLER